MRQINITVGRGERGTDRWLDSARWSAFVQQVDDLIDKSGLDVVVRNSGTGSWVNEADGRRIVEDNLAWVALVSDELWEAIELSGAENWFGAWRHVLGKLAKSYDQDAIAFGHGTSELVEREAA